MKIKTLALIEDSEHGSRYLEAWVDWTKATKQDRFTWIAATSLKVCAVVVFLCLYVAWIIH